MTDPRRVGLLVDAREEDDAIVIVQHIKREIWELSWQGPETLPVTRSGIELGDVTEDTEVAELSAGVSEVESGLVEPANVGAVAFAPD